jgi:hypothetical protein
MALMLSKDLISKVYGWLKEANEAAYRIQGKVRRL